jgi:cytoskeletal protein CcmA (bactofilin family)
MTDVHFSPIDEDSLDTILAPDIEFEGELEFTDPLLVRGRVSGSIRSDSDLHVDEHAVVNADIHAGNVTIRGTVVGNIVAAGRIELFSTCRLTGDIRAAMVAMEPGCLFNGICTMTTGPADEARD